MYLRDQIFEFAQRQTGGTTTILNIPNGSVYTIIDYNLNLGSNVTGSILSNQIIHAQISCWDGVSTTTILRLTHTLVSQGTSYPTTASVGASPIKCYDQVELNQFGSGQNNGFSFASISYVPYSISSTTMATSTLFTSQKSYEGNIEYSYSPFQAFLGITGMILVSLCILVGLFKIFSKFRI